MSFEFRAHKPKSYQWFALALLVIVILNAILIQALQPVLLDWNLLVQQSVILIVPWIFFLFLPSVFIGLVVYHSLAKTYQFTITASGLHLQCINANKEHTGVAKTFLWNDVKEFHFSDFEDNEYFTLVFSDTKNNLILHRETGDFELFFEELKKYVN